MSGPSAAARRPPRDEVTRAAAAWLADDAEAWAAAAEMARMSRNLGAFAGLLSEFANARAPQRWAGVDWPDIAESYLTMTGKVIDPRTGALSSLRTQR